MKKKLLNKQGEKVIRYAIRKYKFGVVSAGILTLMMFFGASGFVSASELSDPLVDEHAGTAVEADLSAEKPDQEGLVNTDASPDTSDQDEVKTTPAEESKEQQEEPKLVKEESEAIKKETDGLKDEDSKEDLAEKSTPDKSTENKQAKERLNGKVETQPDQGESVSSSKEKEDKAAYRSFDDIPLTMLMSTTERAASRLGNLQIKKEVLNSEHISVWEAHQLVEQIKSELDKGVRPRLKVQNIELTADKKIKVTYVNKKTEERDLSDFLVNKPGLPLLKYLGLELTGTSGDTGDVQASEQKGTALKDAGHTVFRGDSIQKGDPNHGFGIQVEKKHVAANNEQNKKAVEAGFLKDRKNNVNESYYEPGKAVAGESFTITDNDEHSNPYLYVKDLPKGMKPSDQVGEEDGWLKSKGDEKGIDFSNFTSQPVHRNHGFEGKFGLDLQLKNPELKDPNNKAYKILYRVYSKDKKTYVEGYNYVTVYAQKDKYDLKTDKVYEVTSKDEITNDVLKDQLDFKAKYSDWYNLAEAMTYNSKLPEGAKLEYDLSKLPEKLEGGKIYDIPVTVIYADDQYNASGQKDEQGGHSRDANVTIRVKVKEVAKPTYNRTTREGIKSTDRKISGTGQAGAKVILTIDNDGKGYYDENEAKYDNGSEAPVTLETTVGADGKWEIDLASHPINQSKLPQGGAVSTINPTGIAKVTVKQVMKDIDSPEEEVHVRLGDSEIQSSDKGKSNQASWVANSNQASLVQGQKEITIKVPHDAGIVYIKQDGGKQYNLIRKKADGKNSVWVFSDKEENYTVLGTAATTDSDGFQDTVVIKPSVNIFPNTEQFKIITNAKYKDYSAPQWWISIDVTNEKPKITPKQDSKLSYWVSDKKLDEDALLNLVQVSDKEDGELNGKEMDSQTAFGKLKVELTDAKSIDLSKKGTYEIKYKATDSQGLTTEHSLTIQVKEADPIIPQKGDDKPDVPDHYVLVEFKGGEHGKINDGETSKFWVKPNEEVTLLAPKVTPDKGYTFKEWDKPVKGQFSAEKTEITATYNDPASVIPQDGEDKPDNVPDGYVLVEFKPGDHGKIDAGQTTKFWVKPNEDVTLVAPNVTPEKGYTFKEWDKPIKGQFRADKTEITATYNDPALVIPQPGDKKPDNVPDGYVLVEFKGGDHGKINDGQTTKFWVKPNEDVTLVAPNVTPDQGYTFKSWDKATTGKFTEETTTITATYNDPASVIPQPGDKKPDNVPDNYVLVEFKDGDHGKIDAGQTTKFWVKPNEDVTLVAPNVTPEKGYTFKEWDKPTKGQFSEETTTITATYNDPALVIPQPGDKKPDNVPDGYVLVEFKAGDHGKINAGQTTKFWVKPNEEVTLTAPEVTPEKGYTFKAWDKATEGKFSKATEITATYQDPDHIIPQTGETKPNDVPDNYVLVDFSAGDHGKINDGQTTKYWVNPEKEVTLTAPEITPEKGYAFKAWDQKLTNTFKVNTTIKATYQDPADVIPGMGEERPDDVPNNYVLVDFSAGDHGQINEGQTTKYWVNPEKEVTLTAPEITPNKGYAFKSWDKATTGKFTQATTITATYQEPADVIPETGEGKPSNVPDNYVLVEFDAGDNGKINYGEKTKFWVNPEKEVTLTAPQVIPNKGYTFTNWDHALKGTFSTATTIKAQYNAPDDVIPGTGKERPDNVPENYVLVEFKPGDHGKINAGETTKLWVNPEKDVTLTAPQVTPEKGYTFKEWDKPTEGKFAEGTTITATYNDPALVIPQDGADQPDNVPDGYVLVEFKDGDHGKINDGQTTKFWVKPNEDVTLVAPNVTPDKGYTFKEWDKPVKGQFSAEKTEITATYNDPASVIPQPGDKKPDNVPDNYVLVEFKDGDHGKINEGETTKFWVKPNEDVTLVAPKVTPDKGYTFKAWDKATTGQFSEKTTTITATYNDPALVIPQDGEDKPDNVPDNYVLVEFKGGEHGKINEGETTKFWVKPNEKVTLNAPKVTPNKGYTFKAWNKATEGQFNAEKTEITATYNDPALVIPQKGEDKPDNVPDDYVLVEFDPGDHGKINDGETSKFWVNPNEKVSLTPPKVTPNNGYLFKGWDGQLIGTFKDQTKITAQYDELTRPKAPTVDEITEGDTSIKVKVPEDGDTLIVELPNPDAPDKPQTIVAKKGDDGKWKVGDKVVESNGKLEIPVEGKKLKKDDKIIAKVQDSTKTPDAISDPTETIVKELIRPKAPTVDEITEGDTSIKVKVPEDGDTLIVELPNSEDLDKPQTIVVKKGDDGKWKVGDKVVDNNGKLEIPVDGSKIKKNDKIIAKVQDSTKNPDAISDPTETTVKELVRPKAPTVDEITEGDDTIKVEVPKDGDTLIVELPNSEDPEKPQTIVVKKGDDGKWKVGDKVVDNNGKLEIPVDGKKIKKGDKIIAKVQDSTKGPNAVSDPTEKIVKEKPADKDLYEPEYKDQEAKPGDKVEIDKPSFKDKDGNPTTAPEGTKFRPDGDQPGVTIDPNTGAITVEVPKDKQPGDKIEVPVIVEYPDGTTDKVTVTVTVGKLEDKDLYEPEYKDQEAKPGDKVEIDKPSFKDKDGNPTTAPGGTKFRPEGGQPGVTIDPNTGAITVEVPKDKKPGDKIEVPVIVEYPDGTTDKVTVTVTVGKLEDKDLYEPEYKDQEAKPGDKVEIDKPSFKDKDGNPTTAPEGTKFRPDGDQPGVTIDPNTGAIIVEVPKDKQPGDKIEVPVIVEYPDGTTDKVTVTVTVGKVSDKDLYEPEYKDQEAKPGDKVEIDKPSFKDKDGKPTRAPEGTKFRPDGDQPGVTIDPNTGAITVEVPKDKQPGDKIDISVIVEYPDGTTDKVTVTVRVGKGSDAGRNESGDSNGQAAHQANGSIKTDTLPQTGETLQSHSAAIASLLLAGTGLWVSGKRKKED
ncbi:LPXTG cell wall anchor domain-containing protein [Atopobacter sp. AH10]|uniref:YPDG domain-containing protein n=1 Tax=Atopobacter sp. AH10 TaxID=2315861 RepID=UPI000EF1E64C|nr:YPDG domain-containing protein [Atopobacter sp. AH10]RLK64078.1 LPXTG cell wall anchor domain-containing protein [Atopobacter sp. AH10]